jgi:hypothetical protein
MRKEATGGRASRPRRREVLQDGRDAGLLAGAHEQPGEDRVVHGVGEDELARVVRRFRHGILFFEIVGMQRFGMPGRPPRRILPERGVGGQVEFPRTVFAHDAKLGDRAGGVADLDRGIVVRCAGGSCGR